LKKICDRYRKNDGSFDVVVPGGGGKDSSYVAWMLKNKLGMNPLCVCAVPPLFTDLGRKNLRRFAESGFTVLEVTPNAEVSRKIGREAFVKYGQPQLTWLYAILATPYRIAVNFNIPFIMYGEEAESEYGGSRELEKRPDFTTDHVRRFYYSGIDIRDLIKEKTSEADYYWMSLPTEKEVNDIGLFPAHWSYFELWDEYAHLDIAREKCGLTYAEQDGAGAYNNYSHVDQKMYGLHMYLAYLKFGFSRTTTDASIDIRYNKISRDEAIKLIQKLDHVFPEESLPEFLEYFEMDEEEFWETTEKFRNKDIWEKIDGVWKLIDDI